MLAEQFIDRLEQQGLLDAKVVKQLRRKLNKVKDRKKITAEQIARLLVDAGHLTQFQATKLVAELTSPKESSAVEIGATRQMGGSDELAIKPSKEDLDMEVKTPMKSKEPSEPKRAFRAPPAPPPAAPTPEPADDLLDDLVETEALGDTAAAGDPLGDIGTGGAAAVAPSQRTGSAQLMSTPTSVWDSRLLLIGGGILGGMVVVGLFLYLALTRGKADEMFEQAQKAYRDGQYAQAAKLYEKLLEDYPRHPSVGLARVKVVTAKLRQTYQTPKEGLRVAKEDLPKIKKEEAFDEARPELAAMLPDIAEAFIKSALATDDVAKKKQFLEMGVEAMELVNDPEYIPTSLRQSRLAVIRETSENMKRVERAIYADRDLKEAVQEIEAAVDAGQTGDAYKTRKALLLKYPGLADAPALIEALQKVTAREKELVKVVRKSLDASTEDHAGTDAVRVILSGKRGQNVSGVANQLLFVQAKGTVFALDAPSGKVVWTRYVGLDYPGQPIPLDSRVPGSDCLVVDGQHNELQRLDAKTGKLKWRLAFDKPFSPPTTTEDAIYATTHDGRVYRIDPETGASPQHTQLPLTAKLSPAVDSRRNRIFQLGHHDNLYVLDRETMKCVSVYYLGHKPGTTIVPPTVVLGHVFVAEQINDQVAIVHILRLEEDGVTLKEVQSPLRLRGRVRVPMFASRRRVMMVTDLGAIYLYDVDLNSPDKPIDEAASQPAHFLEPTNAFPLLDRGYLWLGERRLTKYQVQTSKGELPRLWVTMEGDQFVAPIIKLGEVLFTIRQRRGMSGITVAAIPANEKSSRWEVDLAGGASYVGPGAGNQLEILTPTGQLFQVDPNGVEAGSMIEPVASIAIQDAAAIATRVGETRVFSASRGYREVAVLNPSAKPPLKKLELNVTRGQATAPVTGFQGGLLVPMQSGEVVLLDIKGGLPIVDPFHPPVAAGAKVRWGRPAVFPEGDEFVIADNRQQLFKVSLKSRPRRNLSELAVAEPQGSLEPQLATTSDRVYAIQRTGGADTLIVFRRDNLQIAAEVPLDGRVEWGPHANGEQVFLGTREQLISLKGDGIDWTLDSPGGPLAGAPVPAGDQLVAAFTGGGVVWIDAAEGKVVKTAQSAEPLASSPVVVGNRVAVIGHGGNLLLLNVPTTSASVDRPALQLAAP